MVVRLFGNVDDTKFAHPLNALPPIIVIELGKHKEVKPVQFRKVEEPIEVTVDGNPDNDKLVHP